MEELGNARLAGLEGCAVPFGVDQEDIAMGNDPASDEEERVGLS